MVAITVVAILGAAAVVRMGLRVAQQQESAQAVIDRAGQFEYRHRGGVVYVIQSKRTGRCYLATWHGGIIEVVKEECQ